jgi:FPC/CPF motif-containing protein YcgG
LKVDGFCFELRGPNVCSDIKQFASSVRRLLATLSKNNPSGRDSLERFGGNVSQSTWFFEFLGQTLFVTTFAPFYDSNSHSRACLGAPDTCYVLLQPEDSFRRHKLNPDTPLTDWEMPKTMRDHIRKQHWHAGKPYTIPQSASYPAADHIVKAERIDGPVIRWWEA